MRRCREKLTATEAKLKAAVQDKTNFGIEKAALERELKGLRGQAGRLTKVPLLPSLPADLPLCGGLFCPAFWCTLLPFHGLDLPLTHFMPRSPSVGPRLPCQATGTLPGACESVRMVIAMARLPCDDGAKTGVRADSCYGEF